MLTITVMSFLVAIMLTATEIQMMTEHIDNVTNVQDLVHYIMSPTPWYIIQYVGCL